MQFKVYVSYQMLPIRLLVDSLKPFIVLVLRLTFGKKEGSGEYACILA